jgi:hypothetical protein
VIAPFPEDFPGGDEFLDDSRRGKFEEAATIGGVTVALFDHDGAKKTEAALELPELVESHGVIVETVGTLGHGEMLAYSLFVRQGKSE